MGCRGEIFEMGEKGLWVGRELRSDEGFEDMSYRFQRNEDPRLPSIWDSVIPRYMAWLYGSLVLHCCQFRCVDVKLKRALTAHVIS